MRTRGHIPIAKQCRNGGDTMPTQLQRGIDSLGDIIVECTPFWVELSQSINRCAGHLVFVNEAAASAPTLFSAPLQSVHAELVIVAEFAGGEKSGIHHSAGHGADLIGVLHSNLDPPGVDVALVGGQDDAGTDCQLDRRWDTTHIV